MTRQAYKLTKDRFDHAAGSTVYLCSGHDYGCARDDTNTTGVYHVSVTLKADGSYPFFTVPERDLQPIPLPQVVAPKVVA
jgi:hypothetical protein